MKRRDLLAGMAAFGGAGAIGALGLPQAARAAADFSGRTIEWVIPFGEGGGNDVWARFLAPYLSRHLPGNPNVIVRNVPGGGSVVGANQFAARARPDGMTLLGMSGSTQFPYLLGDRNVRYDYRDLTAVLISPTGGVVYVPASLGISGAEEIASLQGRDLVYGNQGPTTLDLVPLLAFSMLGLSVRHVFGMQSRGEARIALERGEVSIDYQTSSAYLTNVQPLVDAGTAVPLFSWGTLDAAGNVQRDPTFPDLPHFLEVYEMVHGEAPSGAQGAAYMSFFSAGFPVQKLAVLKRDTPAEIVEAYRAAFAAAAADPDLLAAKDEVLGVYEQGVGEAIDPMYELATTIDEDARTWMRDHLTANYNARF